MGKPWSKGKLQDEGSHQCLNDPHSAGEPRLVGRFIARDGGFTSVGVVVALLLVVALLFTAAQVRWLASTSADIQFVADAGALAAQNVVAEYEVIAQIADGVVLSLSLFGLSVFGIAIVVSCIPYCQQIGVKLMDFGRKVLEARDKVAEQAGKALDALQRALPFLCVVNAARVISSNRISPNGSEHYIGIAIPLPLFGEKPEFPDDNDAFYRIDVLEEYNARTAEMSDETQRVYDIIQQSKLEGYLADCGNAPGRCLYERTSNLAGLSGAQNPFFSSVDTWGFEYALERAKAYYQARLSNERPTSTAPDEQVRSFARMRFYTYAVSEMQRAYVYTNPSGVMEAFFPLMPCNNTELRATTLYTEQVYPVSADGVIHGSPACPGCTGGLIGFGSVAQLENGVYKVCETCGFDINTIGRVASATTATNTGFEFHYRKVADAAKRYQDATHEWDSNNSATRQSASESFNIFKQALEALKSPRIDPHPPGRNGCIAIVIDPFTHGIPIPFTSALLAGDASLGPRVAISAAAMASDEASRGNNTISSFLDRLKADTDISSAGGVALGIFDGVLNVWGNTLLAYSEGVDSMVRGIGDFLRSIPLVGSTPLASWAENALRETLEFFGLQGVDLSTPKPVLVNSIHVARASDSGTGRVLASAKEIYSLTPGSGSGTIGSSLIDGLLRELENQGNEFLESEFVLFTISFGSLPGLPEIPIKVSLPAFVVDTGRGILADLRSSLSALLGGGGNDAIWE